MKGMMNMLHFDKFIETLPIMGKGMTGIFIVCIIFILLMVIMGKITDKMK